MGKTGHVFRADRLRLLQGDMGQQEFADYLDINQSQLQKYLHGKSDPSAAILVKIALKLEVSTDYLLSGMPEKPSDQIPGLSSKLALLLSTLSKKELQRIERLIEVVMEKDGG